MTDLMPVAFGRVIDQIKGIRDEGPLELFVGAPTDSQRKVKLGLWLSQRNGRVYAGHKIVVRRDPKRGNSIRLEALDGAEAKSDRGRADRRHQAHQREHCPHLKRLKIECVSFPAILEEGVSPLMPALLLLTSGSRCRSPGLSV